MDLRYFENAATRNGCQDIAGIDEAGRGPLAGPVVSAAVILPLTFHNPDVNDSKKLSPKKRERLYDEIYTQAVSVGIGIVDSIEIDRINILQASLLAMAMAAKNLEPRPDYLLIDGTFCIHSDLPQQAIPKGDALSISIAAASIIAKVSRDRLMEKYHHYYPQFNFPQHKGYPTRSHKEAIRKYGFTPIHRKSFKGVKEFICKPNNKNSEKRENPSPPGS
ncbi:MAG: ribonuclease HII [Deltaproteobacteria bacterium]|nr:ribonuclease HII [Deltaproteobacteria bacterium]